MAVNLKGVRNLKRLALSDRTAGQSVPGVLIGGIPAAFGPIGTLATIAPTNLAGAISGVGNLSGTLVTAAPGTAALVGSISGSGALTGALTASGASGLVQARKGRLSAAMAA